MLKVLGVITRRSFDSNQINFVRCMASGRNIYVKGGSNKQDIPTETKELIQNARDPDDYSWQLGPGIQEPKVVDLTTEERTRATQYKVKYKGHRIMENGADRIKYFPHAGEEIPDEPPSPVLMVEKTGKGFGQPYWIKDYLTQIGLGKFELMGQKVFLPNTPSVCMILYRLKHVVKITPLKFPNGIPENFDPETHGFKLSPTGEFTITDIPDESTESIAARAEWMKIDYNIIRRFHHNEWKKPWGSPLGNHNYQSDSRWVYPAKNASLHEKNKPKNRKWS